MRRAAYAFAKPCQSDRRLHFLAAATATAAVIRAVLAIPRTTPTTQIGHNLSSNTVLRSTNQKRLLSSEWGNDNSARKSTDNVKAALDGFSNDHHSKPTRSLKIERTTTINQQRQMNDQQKIEEQQQQQQEEEEEDNRNLKEFFEEIRKYKTPKQGWDFNEWKVIQKMKSFQEEDHFIRGSHPLELFMNQSTKHHLIKKEKKDTSSYQQEKESLIVKEPSRCKLTSKSILPLSEFSSLPFGGVTVDQFSLLTDSCMCWKQCAFVISRIFSHFRIPPSTSEESLRQWLSLWRFMMTPSEANPMAATSVIGAYLAELATPFEAKVARSFILPEIMYNIRKVERALKVPEEDQIEFLFIDHWNVADSKPLQGSSENKVDGVVDRGVVVGETEEGSETRGQLLDSKEEEQLSLLAVYHLSKIIKEEEVPDANGLFDSDWPTIATMSFLLAIRGYREGGNRFAEYLAFLKNEVEACNNNVNTNPVEEMIGDQKSVKDESENLMISLWIDLEDQMNLVDSESDKKYYENFKNSILELENDNSTFFDQDPLVYQFLTAALERQICLLLFDKMKCNDDKVLRNLQRLANRLRMNSNSEVPDYINKMLTIAKTILPPSTPSTLPNLPTNNTNNNDNNNFPGYTEGAAPGVSENQSLFPVKTVKIPHMAEKFKKTSTQVSELSNMKALLRTSDDLEEKLSTLSDDLTALTTEMEILSDDLNKLCKRM